MAQIESLPSTDQELPAEIAIMSFEDTLEELEEIVQRLDSGKVSLDDSIAIYTRGTQLKRHCEAKLKAAKERVDKIVVGADGTIGTEPSGTD
ncbi:MAG: exodeoxyribonuclease VII small subunit [Alphaproteobacteria bacterium]|nr:exodeoxyribonuclease VII small subunit [Alphaproteobacteria bacterium]